MTEPAPRTSLASLVLVLCTLAAALLFVALDPAGPTQAAWTSSIRGMVSALIALLAAAGAGGAVLHRLAPDLLEDDRSLPHAVVVGLLLWGLIAGAVAWAGLLTPRVGAWMVPLMAVGWLAQPRWKGLRLSSTTLTIGAVVLLPGLLAALAPPVDTDELYQHLALPQAILADGGLVGGPLQPNGSRPMGLHVVYACLMGLGGEAAPRLFHLGLTALTLVGTVKVGRAWLGRRGAWAGLLLAGSWTFIAPAGLAANDLPVALAVLMALDAALRGRAVALALAAGLALSIKYTAGGAIAGVFLAARLPTRARVGAGVGALLLVSPWWLRNLVEGLHPLFPFAGWETAALHADATGATGFRFQYLEKYGAGRDLVAMLLLPWNAVMTAETDGFRFLGRLNPAFLALLPTALLALAAPLSRRLGIAVLAAALSWAAGPHWLRYLIPGLPLLALFLVSGLPQDLHQRRLPRFLLLTCLIAGLPANLGPLLVQAADRLPAATGHEDRAAFLARHHPPSTAIHWANQHLPDDAVVALMFDWSTALVQRRTLLGSVEDHVPTRLWLLRRGPDALVDLQAAGATHLIVTRTRFLKALYPFVPEEERSQELDGPVLLLDELLLRQGTLIHQAGATRVYRLDASATASE